MNMILIITLAIIALTNGATVPLTDLLPPDYPDATPQTATEDNGFFRGLYVPDNLEKRFDDGSDKSPPAPVVLANSPYGPVPSGSGVEGQYVPDNVEKTFDPGLYVPDNLERTFDDGLYKNENNPEPILVQSPFGLVRAGSGSEGQYVDGNLEKQYDSGQYADRQLEKQYDDGLYKGETTFEPNSIDTNEKQYNKGLSSVPQGLVPAGVGFIPSK